MYIKVLPCLDEIKQRQRREAEKENLTVQEVKECAEKVEKIMDMVEDLVEARNERGPGSLDRRINNSMELEGVMSKIGIVEGDLQFTTLRLKSISGKNGNKAGPPIACEIDFFSHIYISYSM